MRRTNFYLAILVLLLCAAPAFAQADPPPPPPPSPDYFPEKWKEYVYEQDNVKFRFPAEPQVTANSTDEPFGKVTTRIYARQSFLLLNVQVMEYPTLINFEDGNTAKEMLDQIRDAGLKENAKFEPRLVKEADVTVDGHPGKFMHVVSNDGKTTRFKIFVVRNRLYVCFVEVTTGEKHGHNFENDFEKVAMAFLDSIRLVSPVK